MFRRKTTHPTEVRSAPSKNKNKNTGRPTNGSVGFACRQPVEDTITPLLIRHISDYDFRTDAAYLNNPTSIDPSNAGLPPS